MANGNFGGGTGTEQDPYLIEDWTDWFAQEANGETYYKLTADLDGNEYNDGVMDQTVTLGYVDGNGHKIDNIFVTNTIDFLEVTNGTHVHDLAFQNIQTSSDFISVRSSNQHVCFEGCRFEWTSLGGYFSSIGTSYANCSFKNCQISVVVLGASLVIFNNKDSYYDCGISVDAARGTHNSYIGIGKACFYRCMIKTVSVSPIDSEFYMCRYEGKINVKPGTITNIMISFAANCVFLLDTTDFSNALTISCNRAVSNHITYPGISIINKDLLGENVTATERDGFKALTTEEMQDMDALKAAGFTNVIKVE